MKPVPRRDLGVLAVGLAVAAFLLVRAYYGDLPPLHWWLGLPLAVLAVAETLGARTLKARLEAEREARAGTRPASAAPALSPVRPVEPLLVARIAVLAQASAWVGAGFAGVWAGVLAYVASSMGRLEAATGDTVTSALGLVFSIGLVAAALWLESVCRVPPGDPGAGARA
jgi:cobalamin synthase